MSLDFRSDAGIERYDLGRRVIPPHGTDIIDIGAIAGSGLADPSGTLIPSTAEGGYRVEGIASPQRSNLMTEALVFDRKRKTFETYYNTCCNTYANHLPNSLSGPTGGSGQMTVSERESCTGIITDVTNDASYSSFNSGIASAHPGGLADYVSPGSTTLRSSYVVQRYVRFEGTCYDLVSNGDRPTAVKPVITGPNTVWWFNGQNPSGYATEIELTSSAGSSSTWAVAAGSDKVTLSATSGAEIFVRSSGTAFSSGPGDIKITTTANGQTSDPFVITSRKPNSYTRTAIDSQCDPNFGYDTVITYSIRDQLGTPLPADVPGNEHWTSTAIADYPNTNWGQPPENQPPFLSFRDLISDEITGPGVNNQPPNIPPTACPGTTDPVQHWGQEWRIGSQLIGAGVLVQRNTLIRYTNSANHISVVSPVP